MNKVSKKLRFTRESLRLMTASEIVEVAGGTNSDMQNSCGSICYTDKACGGSRPAV